MSLRNVSGVSFSFYDAEEIEALSVCNIESTATYDSLNNAVPAGLYSPEMGPATQGASSCSTCSLNFRDCPGHMGSVRLTVPVFQTQLFLEMYKLLRLQCYHCHRLKQDRLTVNTLELQLKLIEAGLTLDALDLVERLQVGNDGEESSDEKKGRIQAVMDEYKEKLRAARKKNKMVGVKPTLYMHDRASRAQLLQDFWYKCPNPNQPCRNCQAHSPTVRKVGHLQLFLKPCTGKQKRSNDVKGISFAEFGLDGSQQITLADAHDDSDASSDASSDGSDSEPDFSSSSDEDRPKQQQRTRKKTKAADAAAPVNEKGGIFLNPLTAQTLLERLWASETILKRIYGGATHQSFFLNVVPVVPNRFRPPAVMGGLTYEHPLNISLTRILNANELLANARAQREEEEAAGKSQQARMTLRRVMTEWLNLQDAVNSLIDSSKNVRDRPLGGKEPPSGLRQVLEKKEGLFRRNMMGKRVNYAARSVISPDLHINTNEVGLPLKFAKGLTYATTVTAWNVDMLRRAVQNGHDVHPGANFVEDEWGRRTNLAKLDAHQRMAVSQTLLTKSALAPPGSSKKVWRHIVSGDALIANRQPTLHKPSMMAHIARVLPNPAWQTIRLHYANCNSYNADFDGDEINLHCPQGELARSEAYHLAQSAHQYIVPTDGSPLRGLIQDHIGAGILLTKRDTFLTRDHYFQLLATVAEAYQGAPTHVRPLPPAILWPVERWTGKQVISTMLTMLMYDETDPGDRGKDLPVESWLNMDGKAKLNPAMGWGASMEEHKIVIRQNQLLRGVLDKSQYGASSFGMVHSFYELYGSAKTSHLLTGLGRVLSLYLQQVGAYTCGIADMVLTAEGDRVRQERIRKTVMEGVEAIEKWAAEEGRMQEGSIGGSKKRSKRLVARRLEEAGYHGRMGMLKGSLEKGLRHGKSEEMDRVYKSVTMPAASEVIKTALPGGLRTPFPKNCLSLMVLTGAKGSLVNHSQISCLLGQQELEGKRVPIMPSGKSLPAFPAYDPRPRAGGFITDRFLTGVRPQDYYFHCMSGREGLVDTAVKTSRSGYLQRCIVKHMEDLQISYDRTVRDADGSCLQFMYSQDGMDPTKTPFLSREDAQMKFVAMNHQGLRKKFSRGEEAFQSGPALARKMHDAVKRGTDARQLVFAVGDVVHAKRRNGTAYSNHWSPAKITKVRGEDVYDVEFLDFFVTDVIKAVVPGGKKVKATIVRRLSPSKFLARPTGEATDVVIDADQVTDGMVAKKLPRAIPFEGRTLAGKKDASGPRNTLRPLIRGGNIDPPSFGVLSIDRHLGSVSEKMQSSIEGYCATHKAELQSAGLNAESMEYLLWMMNMRALADPGEAVGCLAAQSIGEPSTQMTLNTFHLAGTGMANVTLGIPRLRELVMSASATLKTPVMMVPVVHEDAEAQAEALSIKLKRVSLDELLDPFHAIRVVEAVVYDEAVDKAEREYHVTLTFADLGAIAKHFDLTMAHIARAVRIGLIREIIRECKILLRRTDDGGVMTSSAKSGQRGAVADDVMAQRRNRADSVVEDPSVAATRETRLDSASSSEEEEDAAMESASSSSDEEDAPRKKKTGQKKDVQVDKVQRPPKWSGVPADVMKSPYFHDVAVTGKCVDIVFRMPVSAKKLLMLDVVERAVRNVYVRETERITNAFPLFDKQRSEWIVQTEGVNFEEIWGLSERESKVNINGIRSNDVAAIARVYGAEAGRAALIDQMLAVFGVYGITIDSRHMCLVADYMFHTGQYVGMNRVGIRQTKASSPFQKMSFETCANFLTDATVMGDTDMLTSPSSRIVVGRVGGFGSGMSDILVDYSRMRDLGNEQVAANAQAREQQEKLSKSGKSKKSKKDRKK
jgi:DNA-directed RNA polymerase I subunit RPA1